MKQNEAIGIFDSGIGGVTVLKEIINILPNEKYIYYSDSKHNPYGVKTKEEVLGFVDRIINYFIEKDCKAIVFACNTATALAIDEMRKKYPDLLLIGTEPAYKMIHDYAPNTKTLVMATPATIESERFQNLYHHYDNQKSYLLACPNLAYLIEEEKEEELTSYLQQLLGPFQKENIESVVLGCTHYPLIIEKIENILGKVKFYDGGEGIANHLYHLLESNHLLNFNKAKKEISFEDSSHNDQKKERFFAFLAKLQK